jgi:hypothetical protein
MGLIDKFFGNASAAAGPSTTQGNAGTAQVSTTSGTTFTLPTSGGSTSGNILISTGNGTITTTHVVCGPSLTQEEEKELKELREQHEINTKAAKIAEFKKLPAELRQYVINILTWNEEAGRIGKVNAERSARHHELEQKEAQSGKLNVSLGMSWMNHSGASIRIEGATPDVDGLSYEDLKRAHMEGTLEEQMLEND